MKVVPPKSFTYQAGGRGVLLLHGFAGSTFHVRKLGGFLQKKGYTCHAPLLDGHGLPPEELLQSGAAKWWQNIVEGYHKLNELVDGEVAAVGLSLGGVFSLKLSYTFPLKGIVTMCSPMTSKSDDVLMKDVINYGREYKKMEKKSPEQIDKELAEVSKMPLDTLKDIRDVHHEVYGNLTKVNVPALVIQATQDDVIDPRSAEIIYDHIESKAKSIKWYDDSPHVITIGKEKDQLHHDVFHFLEGLDWKE